MANRQRDRLRLTHYDLDAWKEAMRLASEVYILTADMPADERFGLVAQMRRAAVSVASNIAQGASRGRGVEFRRFLVIARGSLVELDTQLWLARDLRLCRPSDSMLERMAVCIKLINGLMKKRGAT
jgi:four helix bundle protein